MAALALTRLHPCRGLTARGAGLLLTLTIAPEPPARAQGTPGWSSPDTGTAGDVYGLGVGTHPPGSREVYAGGGFSAVGTGPIPASSAARWDGWRWTPAGAGFHSKNTLNWVVNDFADVDATGAMGPVPGVYAAGDFYFSGTTPLNHLARWDGEQWVDVGGGVNTPGLWSGLFTVGEYDEPGSAPPVLYVGGIFVTAGPVPVKALARWDGQTWSEVGGGLGPYTQSPSNRPSVYALQEYDDDGAGPRPTGLYVGGIYKTAGGITVNSIARWDGSSWEGLGAGFVTTTAVYSLGVFDDDGPGPGPAYLYVGSNLWVNGTPEAQYLTRWNGSAWSTVPGVLYPQFAGIPFAMAAFDDDGPGPRPLSLFLGGQFSFYSAGPPIHFIARWDGQQLHGLSGTVSGGGAGTHVRALAVLDEDGPGPNPGGLYVGGRFYYAGGLPALGLARWGCPLPPKCYANCDDTTTPAGAPRLDVGDYICFVTRFALRHSYADCDQNGRLDINDYTCFQTKFALGCP